MSSAGTRGHYLVFPRLEHQRAESACAGRSELHLTPFPAPRAASSARRLLLERWRKLLTMLWSVRPSAGVRPAMSRVQSLSAASRALGKEAHAWEAMSQGAYRTHRRAS